ncbi:MAG: hypothetical protein ABEK36_00495, partial [Candidatus Aenigmatarchaeota archaeon]
YSLKEFLEERFDNLEVESKVMDENIGFVSRYMDIDKPDGTTISVYDVPGDLGSEAYISEIEEYVPVNLFLEICADSKISLDKGIREKIREYRSSRKRKLFKNFEEITKSRLKRSKEFKDLQENAEKIINAFELPNGMGDDEDFEERGLFEG